LEQLEGAAGGASGSAGEATVNLTALEYTNHMKKLQDDLYFAWSKQERVKSLKLAIQAAKLLGHTAVPTMYPAMFCFMVGVLETFGQLVFERIRVKSEEIEAKLGGGKPLMGVVAVCPRLPAGCSQNVRLFVQRTSRATTSPKKPRKCAETGFTRLRASGRCSHACTSLAFACPPRAPRESPVSLTATSRRAC
jgi:hypothetical protein